MKISFLLLFCCSLLITTQPVNGSWLGSWFDYEGGASSSSNTTTEASTTFDDQVSEAMKKLVTETMEYHDGGHDSKFHMEVSEGVAEQMSEQMKNLFDYAVDHVDGTTTPVATTGTSETTTLESTSSNVEPSTTTTDSHHLKLDEAGEEGNFASDVISDDDSIIEYHKEDSDQKPENVVTKDEAVNFPVGDATDMFMGVETAEAKDEPLAKPAQTVENTEDSTADVDGSDHLKLERIFAKVSGNDERTKVDSTEAVDDGAAQVPLKKEKADEDDATEVLQTSVTSSKNDNRAKIDSTEAEDDGAARVPVKKEKVDENDATEVLQSAVAGQLSSSSFAPSESTVEPTSVTIEPEVIANEATSESTQQSHRDSTEAEDDGAAQVPTKQVKIGEVDATEALLSSDVGQLSSSSLDPTSTTPSQLTIEETSVTMESKAEFNETTSESNQRSNIDSTEVEDDGAAQIPKVKVDDNDGNDHLKLERIFEKIETNDERTKLDSTEAEDDGAARVPEKKEKVDEDDASKVLQSAVVDKLSSSSTTPSQSIVEETTKVTMEPKDDELDEVTTTVSLGSPVTTVNSGLELEETTSQDIDLALSTENSHGQESNDEVEVGTEAENTEESTTILADSEQNLPDISLPMNFPVEEPLATESSTVLTIESSSEVIETATEASTILSGLDADFVTTPLFNDADEKLEAETVNLAIVEKPNFIEEDPVEIKMEKHQTVSTTASLLSSSSDVTEENLASETSGVTTEGTQSTTIFESVSNLEESSTSSSSEPQFSSTVESTTVEMTTESTTTVVPSADVDNGFKVELGGSSSELESSTEPSTTTSQAIETSSSSTENPFNSDVVGEEIESTEAETTSGTSSMPIDVVVEAGEIENHSESTAAPFSPTEIPTTMVIGTEARKSVEGISTQLVETVETTVKSEPLETESTTSAKTSSTLASVAETESSDPTTTVGVESTSDTVYEDEATGNVDNMISGKGNADQTNNELVRRSMNRVPAGINIVPRKDEPEVSRLPSAFDGNSAWFGNVDPNSGKPKDPFLLNRRPPVITRAKCPKLDLVIVIDQNHFKKNNEFNALVRPIIASFIDKLDACVDFRIAAVEYGSTAEVKTLLKTHTPSLVARDFARTRLTVSKSDLGDKFEIGRAFEAARSQILVQRNGHRVDDAITYLFVCTSNDPSNFADAINQAELLRLQRVMVAVFGVGWNAAKSPTRILANSPEMFFEINSYTKPRDVLFQMEYAGLLPDAIKNFRTSELPQSEIEESSQRATSSMNEPVDPPTTEFPPPSTLSKHQDISRTPGKCSNADVVFAVDRKYFDLEKAKALIPEFTKALAALLKPCDDVRVSMVEFHKTVRIKSWLSDHMDINSTIEYLNNYVPEDFPISTPEHSNIGEVFKTIGKRVSYLIDSQLLII